MSAVFLVRSPKRRASLGETTNLRLFVLKLKILRSVNNRASEEEAANLRFFDFKLFFLLLAQEARFARRNYQPTAFLLRYIFLDFCIKRPSAWCCFYKRHFCRGVFDCIYSSAYASSLPAHVAARMARNTSPMMIVIIIIRFILIMTTSAHMGISSPGIVALSRRMVQSNSLWGTTELAIPLQAS